MPTTTLSKITEPLICYIPYFSNIYICSEHIGRLTRMSVLDTEVDGLNPGNSMLFA